MGQRGPQPKPHNLRVIDGNRSKRPIPADGVNPKVEIPQPPKHLSKEARREWKRITPLLEELKLISGIDRTALALYCQAAGRLFELEIAFEGKVKVAMERRGLSYEDAVMDASRSSTPNGFEQQSVIVQLISKHREQVHKYLQAFGLSPSARGRIQPSSNDGQGSLFGGDEPTGWNRF
ncbi:MAG TPA: phage terminase small subunit P27 family [Limnobacter sp.]|uniref:phage terminase small subunit P27 family n=1 Tax=Limnobacter sp. TaxID=2003368 RepID=UPI002E2ECBA4|nr:phage terminase small subunit P27 family [Limnobacter sp.]HEX5486509.1 phage terminase small subunit P27 family [Limnobacter sp.]